MNNFFKGKQVLVTGGAGFIGSNLVHKLIESEAAVSIIDDFSTGSINNLNDISDNSNVSIVKESIVDNDMVDTMVKYSDIVFHLAAKNITDSTKDPYSDLLVNVNGTFNILQAAHKYKTKKIIYTSSASVYGNARYLPINENDSLNILNPYAASKQSGENYCMAFYETYGVPVTVMRYSNVYGPQHSLDKQNPSCGVIPKFIITALNNDPINIHGDGEQTRDFTYIDDIIEATMMAAASPKSDGEVFNVATGKEISINDLVNKIINISADTNVNSQSVEHIHRRDIDNLRRRVLNIEKIRKHLRWTPNTSIDVGLKKTYSWFAKG